jgi:copper chaperone
MVSSYNVVGMTCGHCVKAVQDEISALPGVTQVEVDLASGRVDVSSDQQLTVSQVREAVVEAGFQLVDGAQGAV